MMKLRKATLLFLSTLLVLGCTDGDVSVINDDDDDDDSSSTDYAVLVGASGSGEIILTLDSEITSGKLSVDVYYNTSSDAFIGVYSSSGTSSSDQMAEFQLVYDSSSDEVGVRLTDDYEISDLYSFNTSTWTTLTIEWDAVAGDYNITVDNYSSSIEPNLNATGSARYIVIQLENQSNSSPFYIDNLTVDSYDSDGDSSVDDDFDDYSEDTDLDANTSEYNYSSTNATVVTDPDDD
jgi:hypothetical protein